MKIAILLRRDSNEITGDTIAAHNRTKELLKKLPNAEIKPIVLREYMHPILHFVNKSKIVKKDEYLKIDDVLYEARWFHFSIIDNLLVKCHKKPISIWRQLDKFVDEFREYNLIIAHSLYAGYIAMRVKQIYQIPYTVTWHGSDIHTLPENNRFIKALTIDIINNADANHFVSKELMNKSDKLSLTKSKNVLYNGVDRCKFHRYQKSEIDEIKREYGFDPNVKNIAFIGNLFTIKNVLCLPGVFKKVQERVNSYFHFVGLGPLKEEVEQLCKENNINYKMWGYQHSNKIPSIINCMDMVVLPSFNEGLPLITLESLACGVQVVGSRVGGIPEAIGIENTVVLDEHFVENMSSLIINRLSYPQVVTVGEQFSWNYTCQKEFEIINRILS